MDICDKCGTNKLVSGYCPGCKTRADGTVAENQGKRGLDRKPRKKAGSKTVGQRYYEATGRSITTDIRQHREKVDMMFDTASQIEDPTARFKALESATRAEKEFQAIWLPYQASKHQSMKVEMTVEEALSLDDALDMAIEDKTDADTRSETDT